MGSVRQQRALLLGLVMVKRTIDDMDEEGKVRVCSICHAASTTDHVQDTGWLGRQEKGLMGVEVILDQDHLRVISDDYLISCHTLEGVNIIMAVQGTDGHLVYIGQCQEREQRLAVVLDMMSNLDADLLTKDFLRTRGHRMTQQEDPQLESASTSPDTALPQMPLRASPQTLTANILNQRPDISTSAGHPRLLGRSVLKLPIVPTAASPQQATPLALVAANKPGPLITQAPSILSKPLLPSYTCIPACKGTSSPVPQASTSLVSTTPVSTPPVSTTPVSTPPLSTQPASTPPVSVRAVSTPPDSTHQPVVTRPPVSARPVSIPPVSSRFVSIPTVSTRPASTSSVSTPPVSIQPMSTTFVSTQPVSTTSVPPAPVCIPPVSTRLISKPFVSISERRFSVVSSGSLEEEVEEDVNGSLESCLGELGTDVKDSEYLYLERSVPQQQQNSSSLKQEMCMFLENEHEYLNTIGRIRDSRKNMRPQFQNLLHGTDKLADFHMNMYHDLYKAFPSCLEVVRMFLSRKEELEQYKYYIMNAPKILVELSQLSRQVVALHPTLETDIKSSWKRLHFYLMSLEKLVKMMPSEEQSQVQEVVEMLRKMNLQADSGILIDAVTDAPVSLHTLGPLLLHNVFAIKDSSGRLKGKMQYRVLLFAEMIVITSPKKEKYKYKEHLPIRQLHLLKYVSDEEASFVIELIIGGQKKNRRFTFRAPQPEARRAWVEEISRLHMEYASEVKRLTELRYGCH